MDDLNNLNTNNPDDSQNSQNSQNPNSAPYQGVDPFVSPLDGPNLEADPYASLNPESMGNPYDNMNSNPFEQPNAFGDSTINPEVNTPNQANQDVNPSFDALNDMNSLPVDSNEETDTFAPQDFSNPSVDTNNFERPPVINPILSQSLPTDNFGNNNEVPNPSLQDANIYQNQNNDFVQPQNTYNEMNNNINQQSSFNQNPNQNNYENPQNGNYNTEFVKAWMGSLYEKAHSKKFNWPAALFGGIYFLFRKMYLTGLLFILLSFLLNILSVFLLSKLGAGALIIALVINIAFIFVYGFSFYPLYRNFVKNKLNKYKQTYPDNSQLINEASKKGNTSVIAVVIYCVLTPIIASILASILVTAGLFSFASGLLGTLQDADTNTTIEEPTYDIQLFNFTDDYLLEYDSLSWFLDDTKNTLNKGDYSLKFAQSVPDINETFNVDTTTPSGRSTLLSTLSSSLESQAAQLNLSVEVGLSNFVMGTNAYYGYVDVVATDNISRYYFILMPEENILFQFVLSVNDTTIEYETNLEVINILTSVYKDETYTPEENNEQNGIENEDLNTVDNSVDNTTDVGNIIENAVENNVSNVTAQNEVQDENAISNTTSVNEITPENTRVDVPDVQLSDVLR